jgi:hypothetical protein
MKHKVKFIGKEIFHLKLALDPLLEKGFHFTISQ